MESMSLLRWPATSWSSRAPFKYQQAGITALHFIINQALSDPDILATIGADDMQKPELPVLAKT